MRKHFVAILFFASFASFLLQAQQKEVRGVWLTPRSGGGFITRNQISAMMDTIAKNNFNTVYFLAWSRGYPLFRSNVFNEYTGVYTDPAAGTRDLLQEAIVEAHRRGLEIEAWMEYGFVGAFIPAGSSERGPLLTGRPAWSGRTLQGSDSLPIGSVGQFVWMSHNHSEVRRFLLRLHKEIAERYDVDGIELDRIRYPQLNYGYDSATVALYRTEHGGASPPIDIANPAWMRWRADKLNAWHKEVYDSIKQVAPGIMVTNAPSHYGSGTSYPAYSSFLQDWKSWLNGGYVDNVQVQMYVDAATLSAYIPSVLNGIDASKHDKVFAGIAPKFDSGTSLSFAQFSQVITVVRNSGLKGFSVWYYDHLSSLKENNDSYFTLLKNSLLTHKVVPPYRESIWRPAPKFVPDTLGERTTGWLNQPFVHAIGMRYSFANASQPETLTFRAEVPVSAWYEVYLNIPQFYPLSGIVSFSRNALAQFPGAGGGWSDKVLDQRQLSATGFQGFAKIGDVFFSPVEQKSFLRIIHRGGGIDTATVADDAMLILNRRLSPNVVVHVERGRDERPLIPGDFSLSSHPNPFNSQTTISYALPKNTNVRLMLYDGLGREVTILDEGDRSEGDHKILFNASTLSSGFYFLRLITPGFTATHKALLLK